jgi:hypothetical protein
MGLQEQLLDTLQALAPQVVDKNRASLELEASALAVSTILSEPQGLALVEYIIVELECGKKPIYTMNKLLEKTRFDQLVERFYISGNQTALSALLPLYYQLWVEPRQDKDTDTFYQTLRKLEGSEAVESTATVLSVCLDCPHTSEKALGTCPECGNNDILEIHALSLAQPARAVLKNGQYLEIYAKEALRKSGIDLIGYEVDKTGKKAYTSIRYQIEGEEIDVDVHGISAKPLALLLCEAKTSQKVIMNELRRVEGLFKRLIDKIHTLSGRDFSCLSLLITTGEFDQNIPIGAYRRKNWELIDRSSIPNLTERLQKICSEI